jgi:hypothetical protein
LVRLWYKAELKQVEALDFGFGIFRMPDLGMPDGW